MKSSSHGVWLSGFTVVVRSLGSSSRYYNVGDSRRSPPPGRSSFSQKVEQHFQVLGLTKDQCSVEDIRKAYISLAKKYHPDSNLSEEATEQFIKVREAYKHCTSYVKNVSLTRAIHEAMEEELRKMDQSLGSRKHKHMTSRQYLTYDGVGPGTISERQRAYSQLRLDQARDSVFDKKFRDALIDRDTKTVGPHTGGGDSWPQSTRVTSSLQRIANEAIRDSMKNGEFSNLPGKGLPMKETWENPFVDNLDQKINVILGNSGFAPEWVALDKEIEIKTVKLKDSILCTWHKCGPRPMTFSKHTEWEGSMAKLDESVKEINRKIRDRNLKGPLIGQKVGINLKKLAASVTDEVQPRNQFDQKTHETFEETMEENSQKKTVTGFIGLAVIMLVYMIQIDYF